MVAEPGGTDSRATPTEKIGYGDNPGNAGWQQRMMQEVSFHAIHASGGAEEVEVIGCGFADFAAVLLQDQADRLVTCFCRHMQVRVCWGVAARGKALGATLRGKFELVRFSGAANAIEEISAADRCFGNAAVTVVYAHGREREDEFRTRALLL